MILKRTDDFSRNKIIFILEIDKTEMMDVQLDDFDKAVIDSPAENISDQLQNLQIIAFRLEQQKGLRDDSI